MPEGGVFARVADPQDFDALTEQATLLPELSRPHLFLGDLTAALDQWPELRFDGIVGRQGLGSDTVARLVERLAEKGRIVVWEQVRSQRLYALLDPARLSPDLLHALAQAEDALHTDLDIAQLTAEFSPDMAVNTEPVSLQRDLPMTPALLERWFAPNSTYLTHLQQHLTASEVDTVQRQFVQQLSYQTVTWHTDACLIQAQWSNTKKAQH